MSTQNQQRKPGHFYLDKWFLDFVGEDGVAMIFYAAQLRWHWWTVGYTSWLHRSPEKGVRISTRFRGVQMPQRENGMITWEDQRFGVSGQWEAITDPIQARLVDMEEGHLDWFCYQPASRVRLQVQGRTIEGQGYAEQLILTVPAWKIPMDELRWGRFGSEEHQLVWVELRKEDQRDQWLWLNGKRMTKVSIEDDQLELPDEGILLQLDRSVTLEAEKKITSVVEDLLPYIPGFNKLMPLHFLLADEYKWLSGGELSQDGRLLTQGTAIHELVDFKTPKL